MAKRSITKVYSDLSGAEIHSGVAGTVQFGLDGTLYEVDLTEAEQNALRNAVAQYVVVARKLSKPAAAGGSRTMRSGAPSPGEVRAWAVENGHEVTLRGRIPALVQEAYAAAHECGR